MKEYWYDRVQVSIFLCGADSDKSKPSCASGPVTQAQKDGDPRRARLRAAQAVHRAGLLRVQAGGLPHLKEQYRDSSLVDNVTPDQMPESYRVRLVHPEQYEIVSRRSAASPASTPSRTTTSCSTGSSPCSTASSGARG